MNKRGMTGAIVALAVGLVVAVVLMVGVLIPIVTTVVANQAFTGVNATIGNNLTTFILIGVLVLTGLVLIFIGAFEVWASKNASRVDEAGEDDE